MPNAMNAVAVRRPAVAASDVMATPSTRPVPMVPEMLPPCVSAPAAARMPMRNAARIVETALAPIAGANGGELLFAPSVHAVPRLVAVATVTSDQKTTSAIRGRLRGHVEAFGGGRHIRSRSRGSERAP